MTVEELTELLLKNEEEETPEMWTAFSEFLYNEDGTVIEEHVTELQENNYEVTVVDDPEGIPFCVNLTYDQRIFFQISNPYREEPEPPEPDHDDEEPDPGRPEEEVPEMLTQV